MATRPDLRIGDAEREAAAAELREHYAQGRLSLAEFNQRIDAVFGAVTRADLSRVTSDLPHVMPRPALLPAGTRQQSWQDAGPGSGSSRRLRLPAVAAMLLAWLLLVGALLPELRFWPMPGKVGLLLAVLASARWLMRLIFGRRGGRAPRRGGVYRRR